MDKDYVYKLGDPIDPKIEKIYIENFFKLMDMGQDYLATV